MVRAFRGDERVRELLNPLLPPPTNRIRSTITGWDLQDQVEHFTSIFNSIDLDGSDSITAQAQLPLCPLYPSPVPRLASHPLPSTPLPSSLLLSTSHSQNATLSTFDSTTLSSPYASLPLTISAQL